MHRYLYYKDLRRVIQVKTRRKREGEELKESVAFTDKKWYNVGCIKMQRGRYDESTGYGRQWATWP